MGAAGNVAGARTTAHIRPGISVQVPLVALMRQ